LRTRDMAPKKQATPKLIAQLNAELRTRDPHEVMRRLIRNQVLDEIEQRIGDLGLAAGDEITRVIKDMRNER
jgi:hypothetical protein